MKVGYDKKFCPRCKKIKSKTEFQNDKYTKDGKRCYCKICSNELSRIYQQNNMEKVLERGRRWRENNLEKYREQKRERAKRWRESGKDREYNERMRLKVLVYYSGNPLKCACCGEGNIEFLTIDHISGKGNEHRRKNNIRGGQHFYRWLIKNNYPEGFQVLCMNCNFSIGKRGYCPHDVLHTIMGTKGREQL